LDRGAEKSITPKSPFPDDNPETYTVDGHSQLVVQASVALNDNTNRAHRPTTPFQGWWYPRRM
jgi:hypothetical protein